MSHAGTHKILVPVCALSDPPTLTVSGPALLFFPSKPRSYLFHDGICVACGLVQGWIFHTDVVGEAVVYDCEWDYTEVIDLSLGFVRDPASGSAWDH